MPALPHRAAELRIAQAQTSLLTTNPFYAILLYRLRKKPDPTAETMWTDGTWLGYNPAFVVGLPRDQLVGVLAHEVAHVAGLHPWRQGTRENRAWNIACDHVANAIVTQDGFVLPPGGVPPIPGKCPEELYVSPPPQPPSGGAAPPGAPGGSSSPEHSGTTSADPSAGSGGAGSKAQPDAPDVPVSFGEVRAPANPDGTALSDADRTRQIAKVRITVQQALTAARRAGNVPAGMERLATEALEPQVPWREVLARFVADQARHDYSWTRANRRYVASGFILPSLWAPAYGKIVLGCDTSGSISLAQTQEICSEVLGALDAYQERGQQATVTVAWFDSEVYPQVIEAADELKPQGGGGTRFDVVFDWVTEQDELPRGIVMVTDGHCSAFGSDPGIPVLWVLTAPHRRFHPPFGEVAFTLNG